MGIIVAGETTYKVSLDDMRKLIAADIGVPADRVIVQYVISDVGDQRDPWQQVTSINVIIRNR